MTTTALVLIVSGAVVAARAEQIRPTERALANAEKRLEAARGQVTVTADRLYTSQSVRMARLSVVRACQADHDAVERVRTQAEKALAIARSEAAEAEQSALEATRELENSRRAMDPIKSQFLGRPLLAYELPQRGALTFNVLTGAIDLTLEPGPVSAPNAGDLDAMIEGRSERPQLNPLRLAASTGQLTERVSTNYADVAAQLAADYGAGNFYLLSRRFMTWATPERLAGDLFNTSSKSSRLAALELALERRQIQLEYEDLSAWLQLKGIKDPGSSWGSIVAELIRTGSYPRLGLSIARPQIEFNHWLDAAGRTELPREYLTRIDSKITPERAATRVLTTKRPAIAIIWRGTAGVAPTLGSYLDGNFRSPAVALGDLPKLLPAQIDSSLRRLLGHASEHGMLEIDATARSRRSARAAIGLRKEDLETSAVTPSNSIDLRQSDFGEIIALFLNKLAAGNQGSCSVDRLELDRSNGRLEADFTLRHNHVWSNRRAVQADLKDALGAVGTDVEDLADHLPDSAFDSSRKRYHDADKRAHEAGKLAYEAQHRAHEAASRMAAMGEEINVLRSEIARAQAELRTATEREALARHDAQTACVEMLRLDQQLRLARNRAQGLDRFLNAKPLVYDDREGGRKR
jgi:hypothetical protein